jgi:8-amino-7-oxononanoate synthase
MKGLDVRPIVPPTIGKGKECLRVVLHSFNQESDIDKLIEALG